MSEQMNRRDVIKNTATLAAAAALPACGGSDEPVARPAGVPVGPYGADSTAEEVTAGLDLTGKTVVITGANSGLGFETARVLAMRGANIIGTGRTLEKAEKAAEAIDGQVTPLVLELSDFDSVNNCAAQIRAMDIPLDILICNAGIMALPELEQVNGIERQFVVNHLGHFAFTTQLVDQVKAAEQGRIISVSSMGHLWAPEAGIELDNLSGERDYSPNKMYGQSKLANGLFAFELARRLQGTRATSNAVHPGIINTNLGRHFEWWKRMAANLIGWTFMKSTEAGAATQCYVASSPELAKVSGYYFADCNPEVPGALMNDPALAEALWDVSIELTGVNPDV
ncbi:MAG: SDR family oxidoreductase [Gammaproteobacteria bacterium]|nr:SDR family oxidoreductase [Gammaproteobacteria bacterium]